MRNLFKVSFLFVFLVLFTSLQAQRNRNKKGDCPTYSEDLKDSLPIFDKPRYDTIRQTVNSEDAILVDDAKSIDSVSLELKRYYKTKEYGRGWRIQIWDGQNHIEMNAAIDKYNLAFEELELPIHDTYDRTMFRVRIGDFTDHLEAFRSLQLIKEEFPRALLVPDTIELDKI